MSTSSRYEGPRFAIWAALNDGAVGDLAPLAALVGFVAHLLGNGGPVWWVVLLADHGAVDCMAE